jgi:hypothetical protein
LFRRPDSRGLPAIGRTIIVFQTMSDPITDVRDISKIGYRFVVSKALFAALDLDLFSHLSGRRSILTELATTTGVAENRLTTLLNVLVSVGPLAKDGSRYANAPTSEDYLVRGAKFYYGDYFCHQIARQIYPLLLSLDDALFGTGSLGGADSYETWLEISDQAELFSRSQHVGSLGPASVLAKQADFSGRRKLLDVAGGTGAFSIALCRNNPELHANILDFPKVTELAKGYIAEAGFETQIDTLSGNALTTAWPGGQDAVLMSYLQSALAGGSDRRAQCPRLRNACARRLGAGARLMADDDLTGPVVAPRSCLSASVSIPERSA